MKTLYELTMEARRAVGIYKNPDLDEWKAAIDPVLHAAGQPAIGDDHVISIDLDDEWLSIDAEYYCRGCRNEDRYTLPMRILEASDPMLAAKEYRMHKRLECAKNAVTTASIVYERSVQTLSEIEAEYKLFKKLNDNA